MVRKLFYVAKNPLDELSCSLWIVQRYVIGNGVQVA